MPGEWYEVPNSNLDRVQPTPLPPVGYGGFYGVMSYSGGAFDTKRERLVVWGGGHGSYSGNELYAFDVTALAWQRLTNPSTPSPLGPGLGPSVHVNSDGTPTSRHSYDGMVYLPGIDKLWASGGSRWGDGSGTPLTWMFDFDTLQWVRKADLIPPDFYNELEVVSAYDPVTGHVFFSSPSRVLAEYDPVANTWTNRSSDRVGDGKVAAIDPKRRKFVAIGIGEVRVFDLTSSGTIAMRKVTTTGATEILGLGRQPGFEYDPVADVFVAWSGGADVYTLNMDTLVWTKRSPAATI